MSLFALDQFSNLINYYPAVYSGNPLNLLFLNDANKIDNITQYFLKINQQVLMDEQREYFMARDLIEGVCFPFPSYSIDQRPNPIDLSEVLFQKFDLAKNIIFSQDDIAERIIKMAQKNRPEVIVLILVDGLSYYDLTEQDDIEPCFVPGVSVTDFGFKTIIGKPSISNRLFFIGYKKQRAFSFFDYSNELSGNINDGFSEAQYFRIREVSEIFKNLKHFRPKRDFIQIVIEGLDSLCHSHRDAPPIEYYRNKIVSCLDEIESIFLSRKISYQIHLVSDHGILWHDSYEKFIVLDDLFPEDSTHPRYVKGTFNRMFGRISSSFGSNYTLFKAPHISRNFRNNEWGMHGGISAWESIVPFITRVG